VELLPLYLGGFIATFACVVSVTQAVAIPGFAAVAGGVAFVGLALSFWMRLRGVSPNTGLMLVIGLLAVVALSWQLGVTDVVRRQVFVPVPLMGDAGVAVVLALMMVMGCFGALRNEVIAAILVPGLAAQGVMGGAVLAGEIVLSFLIFLLASVYVLASVHYLRWRAADGVPSRPSPIVWARNNAMVALQVFLGTLALGVLFSAGFGISLGRLISLFEPQVQRVTRELDPEQMRHSWLEFAATFDLGRGPVALSEEPVMYVKGDLVGRHRALVYQGYDRGRWSVSASTRERAIPMRGAPVAIEALPFPGAVRQTQQEFRMVNSASQLFLSGRPIQLDVTPSRDEAMVYTNDDGFVLRVDPGVTAYKVTVETPRGTAQPVGYPASDILALRPWMELPVGLDPRVATLARDITRGESSPARQAELIQRYLLNNFSYRIDPAPMPPNVEPVTYFLFEQREGFCEIYAAAMTVMLRTLHIPARVAVGYANGEWDETTGSFLVRQNDAHAWVEAYLPGIGWAEFDPTPPYEPPTSPLPRERVGQSPWWAAIGRLALPATLIALGVALLAVGFWPRWRPVRAAVSVRAWGRAQRQVFAAYRAALECLSGAGLRHRRWETPREYATRCRDRMAESSLSALAPALDDLTGVFIESRYAQDDSAASAARAVRAGTTIRSVLRRERGASRALRRQLSRDGRA